MKDVTFGQYYPASSFVHRLDVRVKILLAIAYIVAVFLVKEFVFLGFAACFLFVIITVAFSNVPFFKVLKSIKAILFFIVLTAIIQLFFNQGGEVLVSWWKIKITTDGVYNSLFIILRITLVVVGSSILTFTTTPVELADGIESLLTPLKWIKFPVHEFALIMSIALRCIPTLMEETDRVIKAQKARGADFDSGNVLKRAKALIPVLIPLLVGAFRRAEELGDAMDARCYAGAKGRTKFKKFKITYRDVLAVVFTALLIVGVVLLNHYGILAI